MATPANRNDIIEEFTKIGRCISELGLNNSHSGNISQRIGDTFFITRTAAMLGYLRGEDIVEIGLDEEITEDTQASKEVSVHRAIYRKTPWVAVVHTHPLTAIALSLVRDEIVPIDIEGSYYFPRVPVLEPEVPGDSEAVAEMVSENLKEFKIVLVKAHGAFAAEMSLGRALHYSCILEWSARVIFKVKLLGHDPEKFEKDYFEKWSRR